MHVGVNLSGLVQFTADRDPAEQLATIVSWTRAAAGLGYDYIYFGQHYLTHPYRAFQPVPLLSRLACEAGDLRLGVTLLLPLHHPVELAEQLATMDWISGGRLFLSAATGYRRAEFAAFGLDRDERSSRFAESLELLRALWTQDAVTFSGRHFDVADVTVELKPKQRPHPPIWVAANADAAVRRAARAGLPWHLNPHAPLGTLRDQVATYAAEAAAAGAAPVAHVLNRELHCAPASRQAWDEAGPHLAAKYASYADWGQDRELPAGGAGFRAALADLARDRFVIGSPDECVTELARYRVLGIGAMHLRMGWPGMPPELARRSLELVAEHVVPALRAGAWGGGRSPFDAAA